MGSIASLFASKVFHDGKLLQEPRYLLKILRSVFEQCRPNNVGLLHPGEWNVIFYNTTFISPLSIKGLLQTYRIYLDMESILW
jgi:hypothetical protein